MFNMTYACLAALPQELLLTIFSHLDIPDLLSTSRVSHTFRTLSLDPLLHAHRLLRASSQLSFSLPLRPSLADLIAHRIYITRTTLAARNLGRNLISIKLNRQLLRRPSVEELIGKGVLPRECYVGRGVAPGLVETKRRVERERIKDLLRGWVEEWRKRGGEMKRDEGLEQRPDVRRLVRLFARDREAREERWGAEKNRRREEPTRAKVLGLRRFWEKVGKEGVSA